MQNLLKRLMFMKTAVVTGGTRGIGRAICEMLLADGWCVYSLYCTNETAAREFAKEHADEPLVVAKCDISDKEMLREIFGSIPSVDLLVNNAGISDINLLTDVSDEQIERIISVNLTGAILATKAVLPEMVRKKSGCVVNISSMWGEVGASCEAVYSASKAGLIGFTKALAKEVGPSGIRVNCVTPGVIMTEMNASLDDEALNALKDETPLGTIGQPKDVADAVEFLISDRARFITGEVIKLNGGMVI